ncbi:unnamed protein product [Larinioides sclopetarius]|uniref:Uncharacterized protein n=1 Tax=Larinioides sclopetarius TaxID=280406 RepID=A0AAV2BSF1_9ARAC
MKSISIIPILATFYLVFIFDLCQGKAFIDPKFLLKGNEGLNDMNKDLNLNLKPGLDLGNMKSDPWPTKFKLKGRNSLKADIGGTIWQDKNKGLSFDLDLKPGFSLRGNGMIKPSFDALGTFKYGFWK